MICCHPARRRSPATQRSWRSGPGARHRTAIGAGVAARNSSVGSSLRRRRDRRGLVRHDRTGPDGIDHDTASFAVNAIRPWWHSMGRARYPQARRLLITADCGGSNGARVRLWKRELQTLANELGLAITVCQRLHSTQSGYCILCDSGDRREARRRFSPFVGDTPVSASKMIILDRLPNSRVAKDRLDRRLARQMRRLLPRIASRGCRTSHGWRSSFLTGSRTSALLNVHPTRQCWYRGEPR